jgi:hypothetical protein
MADRISNRVDVAATVGGTIAGSADIKTSGGMDTPPGPFANNPQISKDFNTANANEKASLSGNAVSGKLVGKNLVRVGQGFIDAGVKGAYHFGDNASGKSLVVTGHYRRPLTGALSLFGGAELGVQSISGGQKRPFDGSVLQAALTGGLNVHLKDRTTVTVGVGVQHMAGHLGNGANIDNTAVMVFVEGGFNFIENGKPAWNVSSMEAGDPKPLNACELATQDVDLGNLNTLTRSGTSPVCKDTPHEALSAAVEKMEGFRLNAKTIENYFESLTNLTHEFSEVASRLTPSQKAELMDKIGTLWARTTAKELIGASTTHPSKYFVTTLTQRLMPVAVTDKALLTKLSGMLDKAITAGGTLTAQEQCQLKLDVLTQFYKPIFSKGSDKAIQTEYRVRADALMKDILKTAKDGDGSVPGLLAGTEAALKTSLKKTTLTIPKA